MTVIELIALLRDMPADAPVLVVYDDDQAEFDLHFVKLSAEGYVELS